MTAPAGPAQEHCPDCGRAVEAGADLCACGFPLMFLRQDEPQRAVLAPSRRPAQDDDTDELPVVDAPVLSRPPTAELPIPLEAAADGLACASCGEVNPTSRTWCAQCGAALRVRSEGAPVPPAAPRRGPSGRVLLLGAGAVVVLLAAAGVGTWVLAREDVPDAAEVGPLRIGQVTASATASPGVDNAGNEVSYVGDNVADDDVTTAWRVDGGGEQAELELPLDGERTVTQVALVPGYAKTDPVLRDGQTSDRFQENGRVTRVRWVFDDGTVHEQDIPTPTRDWARSTLAEPVRTASVRLVVEQSQTGTRRRGQTTAISEVEVVGR